jgi:phosphoribosylformylglycinamidine synthase
MRIDLGNRKRRLGGSALAQVYKQIGTDCPDIEQPELIIAAFKAIKELIDKKLVLAAHDISDGGLIVTALEMAFAGNCGLCLDLECDDEDMMAELFAEEAGWIIEYDETNHDAVQKVLKDIPHCYRYIVGRTMEEKNILIVNEEGEFNFKEKMIDLRQLWEETSFQIEKLQSNPETAKAEKILATRV